MTEQEKFLKEVDLQEVNPAWMGVYAFIQAYNDGLAQGIFPRNQKLDIEFTDNFTENEFANGTLYVSPDSAPTEYVDGPIHDILHMLTQNIVQHFQSRKLSPGGRGFELSKNNIGGQWRDDYFTKSGKLVPTHGMEENVGNIVSDLIGPYVIDSRFIKNNTLKNAIQNLKELEYSNYISTHKTPESAPVTLGSLAEKWIEYLSEVLPKFVLLYNKRLARLERTNFGYNNKSFLKEVDLKKINPEWLGVYAFIQAYNDGLSKGIFPRNQKLNIEFDESIPHEETLFSNGTFYVNPQSGFKMDAMQIHDLFHVLTQNLVQHFQAIPGEMKFNKRTDVYDLRNKTKFNQIIGGRRSFQDKENQNLIIPTHGVEEIIGLIIQNSFGRSIVNSSPISKKQAQNVIDFISLPSSLDSFKFIKSAGSEELKNEIRTRWIEKLNKIILPFSELYNQRLYKLKRTSIGKDFVREGNIKMNKKELEKLIKESVEETLESFDRGDIALRKSVQTDQLLKDTDQLLDILRGIVKQSAAKEGGDKLLQNINTSLSGFVTKVVAASKTVK